MSDELVGQLHTPDKGEGASNGYRILLAEDTPQNYTMMIEAFKLFGYEVLHVTNGVDAVTVFEDMEQKFDLALIDDQMPLMSGTEAFARMHKVRKDTPIIMWSATAEVTVVNELVKNGLTAFFGKGQNIVAIFGAIEAAIKQNKQV